MQQAEKLLHCQRMELTRLASRHLPELFASEPLLSVGVEGIDGEDECVGASAASGRGGRHLVQL